MILKDNLKKDKYKVVKLITIIRKKSKLNKMKTENIVKRKYTNPDFFYQKIFQVMDVFGSGALNFHAYMELRLMIFSWKKCSVVAPFIEDTSWECAIELVSGFKTSSRTTLRNTFYMCLELANSNNIRNIDFISFLMFASSSRLYGRINGKLDHDVTSKSNNNTK